MGMSTFSYRLSDLYSQSSVTIGGTLPSGACSTCLRIPEYPMIKLMCRRFLCSAAIVMCVQSGLAQHHSEGRYVATITHHIVLPEEGTREEILALSSEWAEAVLKKHPQILDVRYLLSAAPADTLELLVLYEYASQEAARGAGSVIQELMAAHWPNAEDRDAFFNRMWRYINPDDNIRKAYIEILTAPEPADGEH